MCAVALRCGWVEKDKPPLHHLLDETVMEQALPVDTAEFLGLKDTTTAPLKLLKSGERRKRVFSFGVGICPRCRAGRLQVISTVRD